MTLRVKYQDRYRLWNDLIRASTDRLFIPTEDVPDLHSQVPLEISVPELVRPIVVKAAVVGRRGQSQKFQQGVYLRVPEKEVEKCRRFLNLEPVGSGFQPARRARRIHCTLPVRFLLPDLGREFPTRNISEVGALVGFSGPIAAGERVRVAVQFKTGSVEVDADVAWHNPAAELTGLAFVDVTPETQARLRAGIQALLEERLASQAKDAQPVVVADDDEDILRFITVALSRHGYNVYQAHSGDEALRLVQQLQPALVVMDILMPGADGADVCKTMRSDAELADIPVIFVSALEPATLHSVADESGATDYLSKPLHLADLINLVGSYLAR